MLSALAQDPTAPGSDPNFGGCSNGSSDGSALGTGTNTRTFTFGTAVQVNVSRLYVFYFDDVYAVRGAVPATYAGGQMVDDYNTEVDATMQFKVMLST